MDPIVQDVITTGIALAAAVVLAGRLKRTFFPKRQSSHCETCPGCESRENTPISSRSRT